MESFLLHCSINTFLKKCGIISFLFLVTPLKGQTFTKIDSIPTTISEIAYKFLPIQSDNDFNFLFYSTKNKKQDFELITIKDTVINRMPIKNKGLDGGGSWYKSAVMSNEKLLLLHIDGYLVVYEKNKKGNYILKETLNIKNRNYKTVSFLDNQTVLLANFYNFYNEERMFDYYSLCIYDLRTKKVLRAIEMDLGKGIFFSHFATTFLIESKKDKIAVAHPSLPFIYIYNDKLEPIETIRASFQSAFSVDSVINATFPDSLRFNNNEIINTIMEKKIEQMERIEKVFWVSDDILGYTVRQPFSWARMFVFYSISEKKELCKKICDKNAGNFFSSTRILINNNKTIWYDRIYKEDKSDMYYKFYLYDLLLFDGAE